MARGLRGLACAAAVTALLAGCGGVAGARGPDAPAVPAIAGTLTFRLAGGVAHQLPRLVHGACVPFEGAAESIDNRTDATAHLRDGCDGPEGDVVLPGATWADGNGPPARAVVMLRH